MGEVCKRKVGVYARAMRLFVKRFANGWRSQMAPYVDVNLYY